MGVGRNLASNKQLFFDTKGFSAHASQTGGDDDLFINQAVWEGAAKSISICVHPEAQTVSAAKATFKTWFWQKMRHLSAGKQYHVKDRTKLGLLQGSYIGFYGLGLALLAAPPLGVPVGLAFALRLLPVWLIQFRAARRLAEPIPTLAMPLLDAWLPIYYLFFGIPALFLKKVAWA
jgi:hypothetical protein